MISEMTAYWLFYERWKLTFRWKIFKRGWTFTAAAATLAGVLWGLVLVVPLKEIRVLFNGISQHKFLERDHSFIQWNKASRNPTPPAPVSHTMGARLLRDLPRLACCSVLETTLLTCACAHVQWSSDERFFMHWNLWTSSEWNLTPPSSLSSTWTSSASSLSSSSWKENPSTSWKNKLSVEPQRSS